MQTPQIHNLAWKTTCQGFFLCVCVLTLPEGKSVTCSVTSPHTPGKTCSVAGSDPVHFTNRQPSRFITSARVAPRLVWKVSHSPNIPSMLSDPCPIFCLKSERRNCDQDCCQVNKIRKCFPCSYMTPKWRQIAWLKTRRAQRRRILDSDWTEQEARSLDKQCARFNTLAFL